jgi:hypothetical protein
MHHHQQNQFLKEPSTSTAMDSYQPQYCYTAPGDGWQYSSTVTPMKQIEGEWRAGEKKRRRLMVSERVFFRLLFGVK